ncbi:SIR2 family protein [Pedobacter sp. GR22-10]|uniref:SIR2 family protein n=1 Tax=Pedobacter sp. GR22-10 TaxID=2994472 RepID=UPI0022476A01|nr:SIR2 family protein [Pedobacter sp. GR22-10]MCX2432189.1 SIR2 family protein [Pedobacter sp. GR22-10]
MPTQNSTLSQFYNKQERYLFLGNGINQLHDGSLRWKGLLKLIVDELKIKVNIDDDRKSNTLLFEEMAYAINHHKGDIETNIHSLKKLLALKASELEPHEAVANLVNSDKYQHFLTTNYDYCIEKCLQDTYDGTRGKHQKTPKYSLFRYNQINETKVWHIHGEVNTGYTGNKQFYPEASILIGFEQYSDYLQKVHQMVKSSNGKGLINLITDANNNSKKENWVHLFYTRDIDIIGFGLEYVENHLWFLLNFRARLLRKNIKIPNTIRWIIPEFCWNEKKDKIEILEAIHVKVIPVKTTKNDYIGFYKNFLENHAEYENY